jgi:hypothetical protein
MSGPVIFKYPEAILSDMRVSELRPGKRVEQMELRVVRLISERAAQVYGRQRLILELRVADESGECDLSLLDPTINPAPGSAIRLQNGYVRRKPGTLTLSLGKTGRLEIL